MAIDVWALGCIIYRYSESVVPSLGMLGDCKLHDGYHGNARRGEECAEEVQKASCESGAMRDGEIPSRVSRNWDDRIAWMRRDPEAGAMPLRKEDEAVLTKAIAAAFVIEPAPGRRQRRQSLPCCSTSGRPPSRPLKTSIPANLKGFRSAIAW